MRNNQSLAEVIAQGKALSKEKESETNWSKIDQVLENVHAKVGKEEEVQQALALTDLIGTAIQSNRSKLSGTGCKVAAKLFTLQGEQMKECLGELFPSIVAALSKTNKVISRRALELVQVIGDTCSTKSLQKKLRTYAQSTSKSVKQGVLELCIRGMERDRSPELGSILEGFLTDLAPEIRARAREGVSLAANAHRRVLSEAAKPPVPERALQGSIPEEAAGEQVCTPKKPGTERTVASVIAPIGASPNRSVIKVKDTGHNTVVRGPIKAYITDTTQNIEMRKALKPGYSLERIGLRLEKHKKEIEEALKKTPRRTPVKTKRLHEGGATPSYQLKKEKEGQEKDAENTLENLSEDILNLSIIQADGTDTMVETKEMHDSIFTGEGIKGSKDFLESCEIAADTPALETEEPSVIAEYTLLGPEVLVNKATMRKL
ncbi:hypothetical protein NECID01_1557 [Nematocida sp. AWRm77]|nr:hypothetical protein NECID01_1557 [Nematocida sp. AWRm77]